MKDSDDQGPETQPVRKWWARVREALAALRPRQHDHSETDDKGRRW